MINDRVIRIHAVRNETKEPFTAICIVWGQLERGEELVDDTSWLPDNKTAFYDFEPNEEIVGKHLDFTVKSFEDVTDEYRPRQETEEIEPPEAELAGDRPRG